MSITTAGAGSPPEGLYGRVKMRAYLDRTAMPGRLLRGGGSGDEDVGVQRFRRLRDPHHDPRADGIRAGDLLNRQFRAEEPNRVWVTDFTYVRTWAGWVYVVFIVDVFSRRIVAWHARHEQGSRPGHHAVADGVVATRPRRSSGERWELIHHSDAGSQGGFNWSSQHLVSWRCRWCATASSRSGGATGLRSPGRRSSSAQCEREFWEQIAKGLLPEEARGRGRRVAAGRQRVGSATLAACHRSILAEPSGRYLSFAEREEIAMLRRPGRGRSRDRPRARPRSRRRSRGSCGATPPPAAASWSTGPRSRSGRREHGREATRRPRSSSTNDAAARVRPGAPGRRASAAPTAPSSPGPSRRRGRGGTSRTARTGGGRRRGARSRSRTGSKLDFPDDESMRISHEAIYQSLYIQGRGALKRELVACLRTGRALRAPRERSRTQDAGRTSPRRC